jgi:hypothetical protein
MEKLKLMAFVASNSGIEHFAADRELFRKLFPNSALVKDLDSAQEWQKPGLAQRMLYEILEAVEPDAVLNNRRGLTPKKENAKHANAAEKAIEQLTLTDVKDLTRKQKLLLIKDLGVQLPDNKTATITPALEELQATLRTTVADELAHGMNPGATGKKKRSPGRIPGNRVA